MDNKLEISQFTGSLDFTKFGLSKSIMSEGVLYVAENMNAFWFAQDVDLYVRELAKEGKSTDFVVCHLTQDGDGATMTFEDGNDEVLKTVNVSYTDFDFSRIEGEKLTVWVQPNELGAYTIFLPSEY